MTLTPAPLMASAPRARLSLEAELRCPVQRRAKCARRFYHAATDRGMFRCEYCGSHWWAMRLESGAVRPQIAEIYGTDEGETVDALVGGVMERFGLPERLPAPMYWQVVVSGTQWDRYVSQRELSFRARTKIFFQGISHVFRRAS